MTHQFDYLTTFRGRDYAEQRLEEMFANGEVCEAEHPHIVAQPAGKGPDGRPRTKWIIRVDG